MPTRRSLERPLAPKANDAYDLMGSFTWDARRGFGHELFIPSLPPEAIKDENGILTMK
jgi:hypothetical protein